MAAKKSEKWMQKAVNPKEKGELHKKLDVPADKKIPTSLLKMDRFLHLHLQQTREMQVPRDQRSWPAIRTRAVDRHKKEKPAERRVFLQPL